MATTRIIPLHVGKGRTAGTAISAMIDYAENPEKTGNGKYISSYQCDSRMADAAFLFTKQEYLRRTGRERSSDDVIAYQIRQSFVPGEITPEEANRLGRELAMRFTKGNHAFVVCTHTDRHHVHNHIIWSAVDLDCECKFRNFWGSTKAVRRLSDTICVENGYSIVENPQPHGKSYNQWLGETKPLSHRDRLRLSIDDALAAHPATFDDLLDRLRQAGYEIKGKDNPSFRGVEQKRFLRLDTLGEAYSRSALEAVIAGKQEHTPKTRGVKPARSNNLLIDIQEKMRQGKGPGYERWAKKFNLKQMAQTVAYLQEHHLMDYTVLEKQAGDASGRFRGLSDQIKNAENRMAEIAVLRTQIVNYAKTRETYVAYRKAGYSKKFLAEHEADILLHKAAKQYFDQQGLKKLPSVKVLNAEYAKLLSEKKMIYGEYRQAREEMKELVTAKANIDRFLEKEERGSHEKDARTDRRR